MLVVGENFVQVLWCYGGVVREVRVVGRNFIVDNKRLVNEDK